LQHGERVPIAAAAPGRARPPRRSLRVLGVEPLARILLWALVSAADGAWTASRAALSTSRVRRQRRAASRERAARRAVTALGHLKGAWVKAGQFAAHRHDLLPTEATAALAGLRDRVPPLPLSQLQPVIEAELGAPLEQLFARFEAEPLGAASVAQVHRARLPSGDEVAVKVQYPWLEDSLSADLALLRILIALSARIRATSGTDPGRLYQEFQAGLRDELDFEREAAVAGEIAGNLAGDVGILVPRVVPSHSTRRVLTMSFHPAVRITDRPGLARLGASPPRVLEIVARAYAKQVFVDGLFHADPHPGNLFVLEEPDAAELPRVLFVDFGLSRRLDPSLRGELRRGVHALIQRDLEGFLAGMDRLGMIAPGARPEVRRALELMFDRLGGERGALTAPGTAVLSLKDEAKRLLQDTAGLQLPNDLLLFAKTLSYVFALGAELAPEVDLMRLSSPYLLQFLAEQERGEREVKHDPAGGGPGVG
jgi:predicted unusual protein kinase regulating ubiquinone biosynthesis (AarF/ABC1/UbiB family)